MPTTPFHSDDANDANGISCITTPQSPPTQPQETFPRCTLLPQHVPSLRVPFAGPPPRPPNYSLRSPSTTQLAPSTKAGFRNLQHNLKKPSLDAPSSPGMCRVYSVPFAGHPPRPPNYSLRSPDTTPLVKQKPNNAPKFEVAWDQRLAARNYMFRPPQK